MYPILNRLEEAGWLSSRWEELDAQEIGRPRRCYYTLAEQGVRGIELIRTRPRGGDGVVRAQGYWASLSDQSFDRLAEMADLCVLARDSFHEASQTGFLGHRGSEAGSLETAALQDDWPGGPWSLPATAMLHQVGLVVSLSAAGHLGEMAGLLRTGEVAYSLPLLSRAVAENSARLFAIYVRPFVRGSSPRHVAPQVLKEMFAAAYVEVLADGFIGRTLAERILALDPQNPRSQEQQQEAIKELNRLREAYVPLFDASTTNASSRGGLVLEGTRASTMTDLLDEVVAWMWPDATKRPAPVYRVLCGWAHSSLSAQLGLYSLSDSRGARRLTRSVPLEHIEYLVFIGALLFQRSFARLTGFYGWAEEPLDRYSDQIAAVFPHQFTYGVAET